MAVSFFIRDKKAKSATIFARVRSKAKNIDVKASTLIKVDVASWEKAQTSAIKWKNYRNDNANREFIEKLDSIEKSLNALIDSETAITGDIINQRIYGIVYAEQIEAEKARALVEAEALNRGHAVNFIGFVEQFLHECETGKRKKKGGTVNISKGTIESYRGFWSQLKAYQDARLRVMDFKDITLDFYNDFRSFLTDKQYSPNTIARMVKICKTICYAAERLKLMDAGAVRSGFDVTYRDVDNIYLTEERIQELYDYDLSKHPAREKERDVFVVGCLTGQRFGDYSRISEKMEVTLSDGNKYIKIKQEKTRNIVYIPLDCRVEAIISKYGGTLPKVYRQNVNRHIKEIGEELGWTETVEIEEQRGAMEYTIKRRFCDLLKTHTCRRSLATNMYKAGASLGSIRAITGHSSEQQLKTYLKLDESERAMLAAKENYFARLRIAR